MTDRRAGFIVTLEHDMREDDAQGIANALRQIRGVVDVTPVVAHTEHIMARAQARGELIARISEVLKQNYV